jgi:O-antigen/teichoic acid export membrane protein
MSAAPTSSTSPEIAPLSRPAIMPPSLSHRAARGSAWMFAQTISSKVVSTIGMVILAWFLAPEAFGQVALAFTIASFAGFLQAAGIRDILVQRQRHFQRWANAGFWMSLAVALIAGILQVAIAPTASAWFNSPQLTGLIALLALRGVLEGLATVPLSRLQIDLRFRFIASLTFACALATTVFSILMAWLGFGAYSFIAPLAIVSGLQLIAVWLTVPTPVKPELHLRRWKYMLSDSALLWGASLLVMIVTQGSYIILGALHAPEVVGLYFFAYNLSTQTMQLLVGNVSNALFPALSLLQGDPHRQHNAFLRASKSLAILAVPACLMQAALAGPVIRVFFDPKWEPAIPVLQVLSVGMAFVVLSGPVVGLLKAQARFATYFWWQVWCAIGSITLVSIGGWYGGALAVSVAVTIHYAVFGPLAVFVAIHDAERALRKTAGVFLAPCLGAAVALLPVVVFLTLMPRSFLYDVLAMAIALVMVLGVYPIIIRIVTPDSYSETMKHMLALLDRMRGRQA